MLFALPEFMNQYSTWAASSIATSVLLVRYLPTYSIFQSYVYTAIILYLFHWLAFCFYTVLIYPHYVSPLRNLPQPEGNSLFNGQWSAVIKYPSGIPMRRWINEIPNDGLIRYLHLFNRERLLITSPKALAEVLTTKSYTFIKPDLLRNGIGQLLGIGVLLAEGDEHKAQRRSLMPAFAFRHIKALYPIFWTKSQDMVRLVGEEVKRAPGAPEYQRVEIGEWVSRATLDIIGIAGFGKDFQTLENGDSELNRNYRAVFQPDRSAQILGLLQFFIPSVIVRNLPFKRNSNIQAASKVARDTCRRLVEEKKARLANKETLPPDIISVALESGGFSDEDLVDNMMTFLAAGHETTASAFTWAMYLLCQNPDAQKRLRDEIKQHIPSFDDTEVTADVIDNMPYLHAICNETLRLWAPVPLTLRDTAHDTTIMGVPVPKGTKVVIVPWAVNYSKELWGEDAAEFRPERWLAEGQANAGGANSNYAFLTFLHGPRSCIGNKFAVAELACLIAAMIGKWEVKLADPDETIEVKGGITARPKDGLRVLLQDAGDW